MSDLYVLWDVIGRSTVKAWMRQTNRFLQMIPSHEKSTAPMHLRSLEFVAVSHLKVKPSISGEPSLMPISVGCHLACNSLYVLCRWHHRGASCIQGSSLLFPRQDSADGRNINISGVFLRTVISSCALPPRSRIERCYGICTITECPCNDCCSPLMEDVVVNLKITTSAWT
jgi:hypothetical protein